ncbi:MAG TPA: menaquinone biosynthesis protein [Deinococcales bacterium]|nr:menaquinone biosynthesis protein [Deinococcales bacterium]
MSTLARPYTLGAIRFTNVAPFMHSLKAGPDFRLAGGVPSEMNAALLSGAVDLANISAAEFIRHADQLRALPDFSVSVLGPVYSVNLFHRVPWEALDGQAVAVTTDSATSVALLDVLFRESGLKVRLVPRPPRLHELLREFPGVLLIGDGALVEWHRAGALPPGAGPNAEGLEVTDLAMRWHALTGMPFAFAVWASRVSDGPPPVEVVKGLRDARRWGIGHLAEVSEAEARRLELPPEVVQHYLWNFRYHLEPPDKAGLANFADRIVPGGAGRLSYWEV